MAIFGYARVSTRDQDLASQIAELQSAGCGNMFKEKASGAKTDRPELAKAIRRLEHGDVLVVTRLDRLARSTRDLLNILDAIAKAGAGFKSLNDRWADTTTPHGRLMLTVLGFRTIQVYPNDVRALPGHPELAVSWQNGFRGGAHARPLATPVPDAARRRGGGVAAHGARPAAAHKVRPHWVPSGGWSR
jgi:hypothetical protein